MQDSAIFHQPGSFVVGCNWWASHAGTNMWRDWQPEVVEADFARLAAVGVTSVRMFPLWPDFQPLSQHRMFGGIPREIRRGEDPLVDRNGVDPVMLERLVFTCQAAHRHGLSLLVGLVTGWMSGRLHAPEAIAHCDPLTDPRSLIWQVRLVRSIVGRLLEQPAVVAWDLGNECNCMGKAPSAEAASTWTAHISNAIRAVDTSRPIISGMHGLLPADGQQVWTIPDQAEHCDILTTHPYPHFTPHCGQDGIADPRTTHHATAETRLYADLGGKPACAEEIGTLGPNFGNDAAATAFARMNLFSLWANDCRGMLWWCGFDQSHLSHTPYEWNATERELGLFDNAGKPRPLLQGYSDIAHLRRELPNGILPASRREVVCILTRGQDYWAVAWAAWILAKQAGFNLHYAWADDALPPADYYLLPSVMSDEAFPRRRWLELLKRVELGAELLITYGSGCLSPLTSVIGATIAARRERRGVDEALLSDGTALPLNSPFDIHLEPAPNTEILARTSRGAVIAVRSPHGHGRVTAWMIPIEQQLTTTRGSCDAGAPPWHRIYSQWCNPLAVGRTVTRDNAPWLALTEHDINADTKVVVAIHHDTTAVTAQLHLAPGWRIDKALWGNLPRQGPVAFAPHEVAIFTCRKNA